MIIYYPNTRKALGRRLVEGLASFAVPRRMAHSKCRFRDPIHPTSPYPKSASGIAQGAGHSIRRRRNPSPSGSLPLANSRPTPPQPTYHC